MATLQKFKLLATQCSVATAGRSPGRSPARSPVVHLRRRKTLRMLLNRTTSDRRRPSDVGEIAGGSAESDGDRQSNKKEIRRRRKLKELFVSSPSPPLEDRVKIGDERRGVLPATGRTNGDVRQVTGSSASLRPVTATFRYRMLRRHWRPVLVTIPEQ